jgi:hypothetical protein
MRKVIAVAVALLIVLSLPRLLDAIIESGRQLFGSVTWWMFWRDGYQAPAALDDDGNGWLEGNELAGIAIWRDLNGNGVCDPSEIISLRTPEFFASPSAPSGTRAASLSMPRGFN